MDCLDANAVQDLMAGALEAEARARAIAHLDTCDECRDLLGALAKDTVRDSQRTAIALDDTRATRSSDPALDETAAASLQRAPAYAGPAPEFGRYSIHERLGAGAMGVVYRATDTELGRDVALKLLKRPAPALTDRLKREARAMAKVNHPNVVAVYDVGEVDGATYIAMELVPGQSLRAWQATTHSIPELLEAYVAAGRGLAAAHAAGVVHRDFKPDNVLVGADRRVRVTDFGLAARHAASAGPSKQALDDLDLTTSGSVLGTPAYMAPEQFTGGNVDARTDQFNFCVALYEALYGQRPFDGKSFEELGDNVCEGKVRPPPAKTGVSSALRAIILRGLAGRPGDRFPTMDHLLTELARDRARPWRRTAIACAAITVALGIGLVSDLVVRDRTSTQINQSFAATGRQTNRAFEFLARRFDASANQVYVLPVMREVSGNHDNFDFGVGSPQVDAQNLERLHEELASVDWKTVRDLGMRYQPQVAVADYKGRLLYTTAAPNHWRDDLMRLPWVTQGYRGKEKMIALQPTSDPHLAEAGLADRARPGLAIFFTRTLVLGDVPASQLIQSVDAAQLLDDIRLDDTLLSIVAPDATAVGDVPQAIVDRTVRRDVTTETEAGGYQVQAVPLKGFDEAVVGHVVMARPADSVLSLFPGARVAFAVAMCIALAVAIATAMLARRITFARV